MIAIDDNRRIISDSIFSQSAFHLGYQESIVSPSSRGLVMVLPSRLALSLSVLTELDSTELPSWARTWPASIWIPATMPATAAIKTSLLHLTAERKLNISSILPERRAPVLLSYWE